MSDVSQLKARFEIQSSNGVAQEKAGWAAPPQKQGEKVNKLSASLLQTLGGGGVLKGTELKDGEVKFGKKSPSENRTGLASKSHSSDNSATPGYAALANVLRTSPTSSRRPAPPPPGSKPKVSPKVSPKTRLKLTEKAQSEELVKQGSPSASPKLRRPHSSSVGLRDEDTEPVPIRRSSPVITPQNSPHNSPRGRFRRMVVLSSSYENALDKDPITMDSPLTSRATKTQSMISASPSPKSSPTKSRSRDVSPTPFIQDRLKTFEDRMSPDREKVKPAREAKASSLPRNSRLSVSPPPTSTGLKPPMQKIRSNTDVSRDASPQPSTAKPAPPKRKHPGRKPLPPPKPPLLSNLKKQPGFSQQVRKELSPEAQQAAVSRESTPIRVIVSRESTPTRVIVSRGSTPDSSADDLGPAPVKMQDASETVRSSRTEDKSSSEEGVKPESPQREERVKSPETPSTSERLKLPTVDILKGGTSLPSKIESGRTQEGGGRGNVDSGFISEAPDDLVLGREISVESAAEEKGGGKETEVWDEARVEKARKKRQNIAKELLETEKTYVDRVRLVAVNFYDKVTDFNTKNKSPIPDADVQQIFLNIRQIHTLNENILQELEARMKTWDTHEGLGDVICRLAPFLKLYSTYTSGFEDAIKMLTVWTKKDRRFDSLVREFEREISTGLGVAHYMLEPVQRIPRYRLLLRDYLKYLPEDAQDRPDTLKALEIISEAADRTNDRIKELENSNEILTIQRSLQDFEGTLLAPSRTFLKKGVLQKFSRKTLTPRMFFLFSDVLLHTFPSGSDIYKFKNEMPIFGMQVEEPRVSLMPHCFNVHSTTRSLILCASSEEEKQQWMAALSSAINDDTKKRRSLRRDSSSQSQSSIDGDTFGAKAPIMVPDKSVTMCQVCSAPFTFTFRRHHCRACGKVACGNCSQWKTYLTYMNRSERVCEDCFNIAKKGGKGASVESDGPPSPKTTKKPEGVLDLKAYAEDTLIAGYVLSQEGKKWNRLWYQIKRDHVLYKFRAHEDIKAIHSMPLPGYLVSTDRGSNSINLIHPSSKKEFGDQFKVENPADFDNWVAMIEKAVNLDHLSTPDPDTPHSRTARSYTTLPRLSVDEERLRAQSLRDSSPLSPGSSSLPSSRTSFEQSI